MKENERDILEKSVISQRYARMMQGFEIGLDKKALESEIKDLKDAVNSSNKGHLFLFDVSLEHMSRKTVFKTTNSTYVSRAEILGQNKADSTRRASIALIEDQEALIGAK